MIEHLQGFPENTVAFACHGHVTREDYINSLVPVVDKAFAEHEKVRLYYEIGPDYESIDPGAIWTDFTTGLEHWIRWERIAIVTDVQWIRNTMGAFGFLMPGEVRLFSMSEKDAARKWIADG
jgi:hypothetical protein